MSPELSVASLIFGIIGVIAGALFGIQAWIGRTRSERLEQALTEAKKETAARALLPTVPDVAPTPEPRPSLASATTGEHRPLHGRSIEAALMNQRTHDARIRGPEACAVLVRELEEESARDACPNCLDARRERDAARVAEAAARDALTAELRMGASSAIGELVEILKAGRGGA